MAAETFEFNRHLFKLLQSLLLRIVRFKTVPELGSAIQLDAAKPVFYALHIRQFSALLVLDCAVSQLGLPSVTNTGVSGETLDSQGNEEQSRFFFLTRRGQPSPLQRDAYRYSDRLTRLVQRACSDPDYEVQIVPVSIFWGRAPINQDSMIKALFADNWVTPGFINQALRLMIHGRQTLLRFGKPLLLQSNLGEGREPAVALRRIARLLRGEFKRERELVLGPNLSHRQVLVNDVVASQPVQGAIAAEAIEKHGDPVEVELRARKLAFEIASDYSYPFIRAYDLGLSRLWNRIYDGVEIHGFDTIQNVAAGAELVYLPCHRSHIDYLLLSYVIYHRGLQIPHIAAGENLNLPLIGSLLRRGGAFFLRRSFKGDALYGQVFGQYLHTLIARGFPIEYFVEGGRSRTGRTLTPKLGLLSMTVESWLREPTRPIVFIPIYIGYERVLEGETYAAELAGQAKKRESVLGVVRSLRSLREQFGRVHVNIGEPIRIEDYVSADSIDQKESVSRLATGVATHINSALVINPINLLALALGSGSSATIDARLLAHFIAAIQSLLAAAPYSERQQVTALSPREIIGYGIRLGTIHETSIGSEHRVQAVPEKARLLGYFRNNVLHAVALPALLALLVIRREAIGEHRLRRMISRIYPYLHADLFLSRGSAQLDQNVDQMLELMSQQGWIVRESGQGPENPGIRASSDPLERATLQRFARVMQGPLEAFFLLIAMLAQSGSGKMLTSAQEERFLQFSNRLNAMQDDPVPVANRQASFKAMLTSLVRSGAVVESDGTLLASPSLIAEAGDAIWLLPDEMGLMFTHS